MADALFGVTESSAAALSNVSNLIQKFLIQESKLLPLVTDYSYLATKGTNSIKVPRSGGFTVGDKSENTSVDSQIVTYASDTITLDQHRVIQFLIEKIANKQAVPAIVEDQIMKATKALALDMDNKIKTELALASASAPDHEIKFNDTSNNDLELVDVLEARRLLMVQNIDPRECYMGIGPDKEKDMLAISDFIHAEKYGSSEGLVNGEIGKLFGMKVVVSNVFSAEVVTWHPSAVGYAVQQPTELDMDKDLSNLAMRYSLDYIAGFEVLDGGKRTVHTTET